MSHRNPSAMTNESHKREDAVRMLPDSKLLLFLPVRYACVPSNGVFFRVHLKWIFIDGC